MPHLDDHVVALQRNEVTQPGFVQTVPGEGMPRFNMASERGNLYVEYAVVLPARLTDAQKASLRSIFAP